LPDGIFVEGYTFHAQFLDKLKTNTLVSECFYVRSLGATDILLLPLSTCYLLVLVLATPQSSEVPSLSPALTVNQPAAAFALLFTFCRMSSAAAPLIQVLVPSDYCQLPDPEAFRRQQNIFSFSHFAAVAARHDIIEYSSALALQQASYYISWHIRFSS
jgi:hypothetical protein